jgi:hypothetical protein
VPRMNITTHAYSSTENGHSNAVAQSVKLDDRRVGVRPGRLWGPPNLLSNGYQELFPKGIKRSGREADSD